MHPVTQTSIVSASKQPQAAKETLPGSRTSKTVRPSCAVCRIGKCQAGAAWPMLPIIDLAPGNRPCRTHRPGRGEKAMATTDTLPPSPVQSQPPVQRPNPRPAAAPVAERSVFASLDRMQVKRDPKSTMHRHRRSRPDHRSHRVPHRHQDHAHHAQEGGSHQPCRAAAAAAQGAPKGRDDGWRRWPEGSYPGHERQHPPKFAPEQLNPPKAPPTVAPKINVAGHGRYRPEPEDGQDRRAELRHAQLAARRHEHG